MRSVTSALLPSTLTALQEHSSSSPVFVCERKLPLPRSCPAGVGVSVGAGVGTGGWVGGGVGYARRHLEMRAAGPEIFDDSGGAFAWQLEAGGGYDLCGCGLFADLFLRYRTVGAIEVSPPSGPSLTLGERRDLLVGAGLRYSFQP